LLTMCEEWTKAGHRVRLYNNPTSPRDLKFGQYPIGAFVPSDRSRDVVVNFRSPSEGAIISKGLKVWFSCDQYTVGSYANFAPTMDKIVCISEFHKTYFREQYNIKNATVIDLPVRVHDLDGMAVEKRPKSLIFTSVPDRGLHYMRQAWDRIKKEVPDASLTITSDYRLWGLPDPRNEHFRVQWIAQEDVSFFGAVKRQALLELQLKADIFAFPNIYDELFCVSLAEAQVCGAYPVTSEIGALKTTSMGTLVRGDPRDGRSMFMKKFQDEIIYLLNNPDELKEKQEDVKKKAIERFHPDNILKQWDEKIFK